MTSAPGTDHDDLMDLASRFAYDNRLDPEIDGFNTVLVNGKKYQVVDVHADPTTGLNALTFRNVATGQTTVAFQGSDGGTDWQNNAQLITSRTPAQFEAAEAYVAEVGPVDFVCGNSLGGGLAAYAAGRDTTIEAVTVNPAPVPAALAGMDAPNVHNYLTSNDMLHQLVVAGGLSDRIIGDQITVPGTAINDVFGDNHIGADRDDPGDDRVHVYDASMATPFSLFHADEVVSADDYGRSVDVTLTALILMTLGLQHQRTDLLAVIDAELGSMDADLAQRAAELDAREQQARDEIAQVFEAGYREVHRRVEDARSVLEQLGPIVRRVRVPGALGPVWSPVAAALLAFADTALAGLDQLVEFATAGAVETVWRAHCAAFTDGAQAITDGLREQHHTLSKDVRVIDAKWAAFTTTCQTVVRELSRVDDTLAAAIASGSCPVDALPSTRVAWPAGRARGVTESLAKSLTQSVETLCEERAATLVSWLAAALAENLAPLTVVIVAVEAELAALEAATIAAASSIDLASGPAQLLGSLVGLDDDIARFRDEVQDVRHEICRRIEEVDEVLRAARTVLVELPSLLLSCQPQLASLLCPDDELQAFYDSFSKVRNLVERSALAFGETRFQLAEHDARTIDALADRAGELLGDLRTTEQALVEIIT